MSGISSKLTKYHLCVRKICINHFIACFSTKNNETNTIKQHVMTEKRNKVAKQMSSQSYICISETAFKDITVYSFTVFFQNSYLCYSIIP